jgi:hypothetical protein
VNKLILLFISNTLSYIFHKRSVELEKYMSSPALKVKELFKKRMPIATEEHDSDTYTSLYNLGEDEQEWRDDIFSTFLFTFKSSPPWENNKALNIPMGLTTNQLVDFDFLEPKKISLELKRTPTRRRRDTAPSSSVDKVRFTDAQKAVLRTSLLVPPEMPKRKRSFIKRLSSVFKKQKASV